ncbi:response regulator [uncultured Thiodictyon sp.]|uniref:hybrid sensor histidine kinase/response regulator n=1 Tax=uncultured Thiodictyon sp. TaxID=1846217 RepID=UPI0025D527BE|nr:response regulator [uncultured Thiodictyon sp.]
MNPVAFAKVFAAALPAAQEAIELAGNPAAAQDDRLTAANAFAESLGDLWPSAEELGPHITELLAVIDGLVSGLPHRAAGSDSAGVAALEVMALLEAHLAEPHDQEIVDALIELAGSEAFDPPLSPEAAALWHDHVAAGDGAAPLAPETPMVAAISDDLAAPVAAEPQDDAADQEAAGADAAEEITAPPQFPSRPVASAHSGELSDDALELLAILAAAVEDNAQDFLHRVADIARATRAADRTAAAEAGREILERFAEASADVGFAGFGTLCAGLAEQMSARSPKNPWPKSLIGDLSQLPQRMLDYLAGPLAQAPRTALVATLAHPRWPEPLALERTAELAQALYDDPLALETETGPQRVAAVQDEDLSLAPADDMDDSVLASFRREGPDMAQRLATVIQVILRGGAVEDALRQAQRYAHTLKGSANVCGVRAVAFLGHHLEDLLEFLTEQELAPSPPLGETLVAAADGLAAMFDVINGLESHDPEAFRPIVQQVLDWANRIDQEGAAALEWTEPLKAPAAATSATPAAARAGAAADSVTMASLVTPETLSGALESPAARVTTASMVTPETLSGALESPAARSRGGTVQDAEDAYLQVPAQAIVNLLRLAGEMSLALSQSAEQIRLAQRTLQESAEIDLRNLLQVTELEKLVDLRGLASGGAAAASTYDPLELDQYDEMYIATRRLNEGVNDARDLVQTLNGTIGSLDELAQQQIKLSQELRQLTMATRLVPVSSVVGRLQRAVRQTCRATGKEGELKVQGNEVQVDGDVLDRLMPALMHVVRNSVDHGIEPADQRAAAGKPAEGELTIAFRQSGDQIEVTFSDDGAGLDLERVKSKAIRLGLLAADAAPTPQELALLTLRPGFSTREQATQTSGRGVGMDVVANTVRALNGSLTIESQRGAGYRLQARFPSSLQTIYCLLIHCNGEPLAMPANEVRFAVLAAEGEISECAEGWQFRHAEDTYPLVHINTLIGLPTRAPDVKGAVVLIVVSDRGDQAVMVDELIDGRELVVKKLGALVPPIPGLLAASILGDGRVVPIVELRAMMRVVSNVDLSTLAHAQDLEQIKLPTVLIVDDSLSMRRVLAQLVTDAGYHALTARDGMDALTTLSREPADVLLVDMEMPQMNGLELTTHLRAQAPTRRLPIAMITSRSTERHRREAITAGVDRYFVKPYHDEEVLDFIQQALEQVS